MWRVSRVTSRLKFWDLSPFPSLGLTLHGQSERLQPLGGLGINVLRAHHPHMRYGVVIRRVIWDKEIEKGWRCDRSLGDAGLHSVVGWRGLVVPARRVAPSQLGREPSDNTSVKGCCITAHWDEVCMVFRVRGFRQVNRHCHCAEGWRARLVETCCHFVGKWKRSGGNGREKGEEKTHNRVSWLFSNEKLGLLVSLLLIVSLRTRTFSHNLRRMPLGSQQQKISSRKSQVCLFYNFYFFMKWKKFG